MQRLVRTRVSSSVPGCAQKATKTSSFTTLSVTANSHAVRTLWSTRETQSRQILGWSVLLRRQSLTITITLLNILDRIPSPRRTEWSSPGQSKRYYGAPDISVAIAATDLTCEQCGQHTFLGGRPDSNAQDGYCFVRIFDASRPSFTWFACRSASCCSSPTDFGLSSVSLAVCLPSSLASPASTPIDTSTTMAPDRLQPYQVHPRDASRHETYSQRLPIQVDHEHPGVSLALQIGSCYMKATRPSVTISNPTASPQHSTPAIAAQRPPILRTIKSLSDLLILNSQRTGVGATLRPAAGWS